MNKELEYALYKGDELLNFGTLQEIAKQRGVPKRRVQRYSFPSYQSNPKKKGKSKRMTLVILED
ncbi:MAG: hypothetical protein ABS944_17700 [Solibacillus sp.]|uniref:hypothetical protein n=1 Tax=Solibacillus sp. TaxID=1909654 RepID=UPI00331581E5